MKFIVAAALFAGAFALPNGGGGGGAPYLPCSPGLYSNPQCCATDILGVADLNCASPRRSPRNAREFRDICADGGQQAACCAIPILGQSLLCEKPVGV